MLKKEARILGLSISRESKGRAKLVGVVFRGRSWLDGVFTCSLNAKGGDRVSRISKAIKESRQYSQLHAVILSNEHPLLHNQTELSELARRIKLPVITIIQKHGLKLGSRKERSVAKHYTLFLKGKKLPVLVWRATLEETGELFAIATSPNFRVPEALRVATLIARASNA